MRDERERKSVVFSLACEIFEKKNFLKNFDRKDTLKSVFFLGARPVRRVVCKKWFRRSLGV